MRAYVLIVPDALDKVTLEDSITVRANVARELSGIFGGYTAALVAGGWVDSAGRLIEEASTRFEVYDDSTGEDATIRAHAIRDVAKRVKLALDQDCVLLTTLAVSSIEFI